MSTDRQRAKILRLVRRGHSFRAAALESGISDRTAYQWRRRGRLELEAGSGTELAVWAEAVDAAIEEQRGKKAAERLELAQKGEETDEGTRDPETGRFLPGSPGGPGRPRGSYDLLRIARERSARDGIDLEELLWEAALGLLKKAAKGDAFAAKVVFERLLGPVERGPLVAVGVNVEGATPTGPKVPEGPELLASLRKTVELAREHGLLPQDIEE